MLTKTWQQVLWTAVLAILLVSLVTPLSVLTFSFLMLPLTLLYIHLNTRRFIICLAAALIPSTLLVGMTLPFIALLFLVPAIVMGRLYKKKADPKLVITAGMLTWIGELVLLYALMSLAGVHLHQTLTLVVKESFNTMPDLWQVGNTETTMLQVVDYMIRMIPFFMALFSAYVVAMNHTLTRLMTKKSGDPVPGFKPIRDWRVPKSFVWYYVLSMLFNMFLTGQSDSYWSTVLWNLVPMLTVVFAIQGISFLFYIAHIKRWSVALPVIGIVVAFFLPYVVSLLGVLDRGLNIRRTIQKP